MSTDFLLEYARYFLSPVILKEGAVFESCDVLENRVDEGFYKKKATLQR
jgi:hypothetical protein